MSWMDDLYNKINEYTNGYYTQNASNSIPSLYNVGMGKSYVKTPVCAYCIDMRKSSSLIDKYGMESSVKIHKSFMTIASRVVIENGGRIRSFNGDGLLALWVNNGSNDIALAVKTAMMTKYFITNKLATFFNTYDIDFGIGIDISDMFTIRVGNQKNMDENDLVFVGKSVNFATKISNNMVKPNNIGISKEAYYSLPDNLRYNSTNPNTLKWYSGKISWKANTADIIMTDESRINI